MAEIQSTKHYDLEKRTLAFARDTRIFVSRLSKTVANIEDIKQLVRASGSVGANYIEANESLGKKDFIMKIKISRREAKESKYWLTLINVGSDNYLMDTQNKLIKEATELMMIFGSIFRKSE